MQQHQNGGTLLRRHNDMMLAVALGAVAATAREDVATAQEYLGLLVPSTLNTQYNVETVRPAAVMCLDAMHQLMRLSSAPQVVTMVLLHLDCIVRHRWLLGSILQGTSHAAGRFCDLLCSIRMTCDEAQKDSLHAVLETSGPALREAACRGGVAAQERQVVQAVLGTVAQLPREEQSRWAFVVGVMIGMADGAVVLDVLPYVTRIGWDRIFVLLKPLEGRLIVPWANSTQEFQQARDALLAHVAQGLDQDSPGYVEFALHFAVTCPDPVWCLSGHPPAAPFVLAFVKFMRRHLAVPAQLRQASDSRALEEPTVGDEQQQQQQQQASTAAAANLDELVDKVVIHILSSSAGCRLLDQEGLWAAVGHHIAVRGEPWIEWDWGNFDPAYTHLVGAEAAVVGPFLQQLLTSSAKQPAHVVVRSLLEYGLHASRLFPPTQRDSQLLEAVLGQLRPTSTCTAIQYNFRVAHGHEWLAHNMDPQPALVMDHLFDNHTAAELLLGAAASPELAAAVRNRLQDSGSSQEVRRGALLALTAVLREASPETQSMVDGLLDQVAQPVGLLSLGLDVWSNLVLAATSAEPSSAVVADAPAGVRAAALQARLQQLQQERESLEAELTSLQGQQA
jgi:hypothetical protein